jgi:hypothetical protein
MRRGELKAMVRRHTSGLTSSGWSPAPSGALPFYSRANYRQPGAIRGITGWPQKRSPAEAGPLNHEE